MAKEKMRIEIWSDIVCPFCYIGKRRFENALAQFPHRDAVEVEWKSFQLQPHAQTDPNVKIDEWLAREKGWPLAHAKQMNARVTAMAAEAGLEYHLDRAVVANTFRAHGMLHFAKAHGKQNEAKERLLRAYFTESKNIDDLTMLAELGREVGLDAEALTAALATGAYDREVRADIDEAHSLGISGVPFFVLDRKYGVSGAQEEAVFLQALSQAFAEWRQNHPELTLISAPGKVCAPGEVC